MDAKILVVDDEPAIVKVIQSMLMADGFKVITAGSGNEAFDLAEKEAPDLIVSDIQMAEGDGIMLSQRIKTHPRLKSIPMILLSALVSEETEGEGLQKGDCYMLKPFNADRIVKKVKEMLL